MNGILVGVLATLVTLAVLRLLRIALFRRPWRRRGRGFMARRLLRRLEATPEQERIFLAEVEALGNAMREAREGLFASREELAQLLDADVLDQGALGGLSERQEARLGELRHRLADAIARFHASLDSRQHHLLAEMVRARPSHCASR